MNVEVRISGIHGRGVFALHDMPEGYYIGNYEGPPGGPGYSKFDFEVDGEMRRGRNDLRYMNSSSEANCEFDGFDCFTTQDIKAGEELTFDYTWE